MIDDMILLLAVVTATFVAGLLSGIKIHPEPFSFRKMWYNLTNKKYYELRILNNGVQVTSHIEPLKGNRLSVYVKGFGDFVLPAIQEQQVQKGNRIEVFYDKRHAEPIKWSEKIEFKPLTPEFITIPSVLQKMREADSIQKVLAPARNPTESLMMYVIIGLMILGGLWLLTGGLK